jgi:hypothetical protein
MLDHRLLQEWAVACGWSVPEAACGWACLVDVEGRNAHDAGTVADCRLMRVGGNAPNVVRGAVVGRCPVSVARD